MTELKLAFVGCVALAKKDGVKRIPDLPDGIYRRSFGAWNIALNGTGEEQQGIPSFSARLEYNGWPAGVLDPGGGAIIAGDDDVGEDGFIAAVEAELGCSIETAMTA